MNLELAQQIETILDKLSYTDDISKSGWKFSLIDDFIIRFQPYGSLDSYTHEILSKNIEELQSEYFKIAEFLVFLFDFKNFKKTASDIRQRIIEGQVFRNEKINFVIYGMNYFVSTMAKVLDNKFLHQRLFIVNDENAGLEKAKQLIFNFRHQKEEELQSSNIFSQAAKTIKIGGKSYKILSQQDWTYNDPKSDYSYKIDLIDENILVSRPSGYIRYQNGLLANMLFDKIVNSELGQDKKYYRIQDYTSVIGSENKARRDFIDYIINGIDKINLMVFYGLNTTMKTVVRLGKLVHPAFEKVRIADTFENALEQIIADKYKINKGSNKQTSDGKNTPKHMSEHEEIDELKTQYNVQLKENARIANILFDRISNITFGDSAEFVPVRIEENNLFYDLCSAIQLLNEDFIELRSDRNSIQLKLQKFLSKQAREIKDMKIENAAKLKLKENFIRSSVYELNSSLEAILNAVQLLRQEENPDGQKSLLEIINISSIVLQDSIGQIKSNIIDNHAIGTISESMFNYRKNIVKLVEIARMSQHNGNVIFENKIDDSLPSFLIGDKRKFNQLVNIYLENAIKYTWGGFIRVYTQVVNKSVTKVCLRLIVEDSGIGIDKYTQKNIFKDAVIENETSDSKNNGFGLLMAKNIARALDAEVGFESEKGVGSKFWFELTFNIGYHDKVTQMQTVRNQRKLQVKTSLPFDGNIALLICDDDIRQNLLEQILLKKGIQSRIKLNYEFIDEIEGKFDFVFVSLQLTGGKELSSFALLKKAIDAKNDSEIPRYIGCVDSFIDPILEEYRKIGVDYFILKSFKITDLDQFFDDIK